MKSKNKLAINELMGRAAYAFDIRDLGMLEKCFTSDAVMSVQIKNGDAYGPFDGREAIMGLMAGALDAQTDTRSHMISNILYESEGNKHATVLSNVVVSAVENGKIALITSGIYRDAVIKNDDGWQIANRHLDLDLPF
jgi:hypothetical protein